MRTWIRNLLIIYAASCCLAASAVSAQEKGIHFERNLSWQQILDKAKTGHKYIFVDCFATWCGPCKMMDKTVYTDSLAGSLFNTNFIAVKMQMDTSKLDNEQTKSSYADAHQLMQQYRVNAFPTFLFFSPDGKLVHRALGFLPAPRFIETGRAAMDPERQYYSLMDQYRQGKKDSALLSKLIFPAQDFENAVQASEIAGDYIGSLHDPFRKDNIVAISRLVKHSGDKAFGFFICHSEQVDHIMGTGCAEITAMNIIIKENAAITALFNSDEPGAADWNNIHSEIAKQYGEGYADRTISWIKVPYYQKIKKWPDYTKSLVDYTMTYKYNEVASPVIVNNNAWQVFTYSSDRKELEAAAAWCRQLIDKGKNDANTIDTYANLLYKTGETKTAISWEEKAVQANLKNAGMKTTLDKMKNGVKTWEEYPVSK